MKRRFSDSVEELHQTATRQTGLEDFGEETYLDPLTVLLEAYDREARLGDDGRASTWDTLVSCLVSRLHSVSHWTQHPEVRDQSIDRPVVIMGLPRTGTTALHKLMAADPNAQALEYWLGHQPDIRPPRAEWSAHPGYRQACEILGRIYRHDPSIESIHSMQAGEADECRLLFMQDFLGLTFSFNATIPSYSRWLLEQDMRPGYRRYRENLQLIGARDHDKRWVLKNSSHLWAMEALVETLPGVRIIQTHRNPVELIASISSLVYRMRRISEPDIQKQEVGRQQLETWSQILEMNMRSRRELDIEIHDVHFETFTRNPIGTLEKIYAHFGLEFTRETESDVNAWAKENRREHQAPHDYSAPEYGLSEDLIRERFSDYIEWQRQVAEAG